MIFLQEFVFSFFFFSLQIVECLLLLAGFFESVNSSTYLVVCVNLVGLCYVLRSFCSGSSMCMDFLLGAVLA